ERLDKPIDTQVTGSNVEYPNDYPDANAGERLEAIEQTQESIINALQTTNENLNNVIDDDSLLTNSKPAKTFSFLTEVSPKTQKIIKESEIGDEINFGDLRQFKAFILALILARLAERHHRMVLWLECFLSPWEVMEISLIYMRK